MKSKYLLFGLISILFVIGFALAADTTAPTVELQSPANGATSYMNRTNFSYKVTDSSPILWCRIRFGDTIQNLTTSVTVNSTNYFYDIYTWNGTITWYVDCSDNATNVGTAARTLNINYDITPPTIDLNIGESNADVNGKANFSYFPVDMLSGLKECRLYLDGALKEATSAPANNTTNKFKDIQLGLGKYNWNVNCTDNSGNNAGSQIATMFVSTIENLTVDLVGPENNAISGPGVFDFQFTPKSSENVSFCGIYFDGLLNITKTKILTNEINTIAGIRLGIGTWSWQVECRTPSGVRKNSSARSVTASYEVLVSTFIRVTPESPSDNAVDNTGVVTFTYRPDSLLNIKKCDLVTNNSVRATTDAISPATTNSFSEIELADGIWSWRVRCSNQENKVSSSRPRTLIVQKIITEEDLPEVPGESIVLPDTAIDINALNETIAPTANEPKSLTLLLVVTGMSLALAFSIFVFSEKKYRNIILHAIIPPKIYSKELLKIYIDRYMKKGISEERIRRHLKRYNWAEKDVDKAFEDVYTEMHKLKRKAKQLPLKPPPMPPKRTMQKG